MRNGLKVVMRNQGDELSNRICLAAGGNTNA